VIFHILDEVKFKVRYIFLGPPGAGKGTQAKIFCEKFSIPHISTGDIFRKNISQRTELGLKAKEIIDSGNLVPDEITNEMVKKRLSEDDCKKGYVLDGYPRTIPQAEFLDCIAEVDGAILFYLSDEEAMKRMLNRAKTSGRSDDNEETIKNRIDVYKKQTQPLIDYYSEKGNLIEIDASPTIEKIFENLVGSVQ